MIVSDAIGMEATRGVQARAQLLKSHTPQHRARQLESYYREVIAAGTRPRVAAEVVA